MRKNIIMTDFQYLHRFSAPKVSPTVMHVHCELSADTSLVLTQGQHCSSDGHLILCTYPRDAKSGNVLLLLLLHQFRGKLTNMLIITCSARLALPGPEEKSIVSSAVPISGEGNAVAAVIPMLLPPTAEGRRMHPCAPVEADNFPFFLKGPLSIPQEMTNLLDRETTLITTICEPTIEEPKTPDPLPDLLASDIEDGFFEDSDDIPTIKLNMKEFTTNLETILQENNTEGDFSKALVALHPDAASIPTPKLKNVSRLRTEHSV